MREARKIPHINAVIVSDFANRARYVRKVACSVVTGDLHFGAAAQYCVFGALKHRSLTALNIRFYKGKTAVQRIDRNHFTVFAYADARASSLA